MKAKKVRKERFWVAGLVEVYTAKTRPGIPQLWDRFIPKMNQAPGRKGTHSFGVRNATTSGKDGEFEYMAAVEVEDPKKVPSDWTAKEIPAGEYLLFTHCGPISQFTRTVDYLWSTWLPNSKHRLRIAPDLELYDVRFSGESPDSAVDILIPIEP